ncbi:MAG TPA: tRNA (N6-isopentenyl adenosine(37)-C2)-methylthiotransferase MiaB [Bacteroidales bacterium]|nr:tRNA (N6-isopentenyl adenosine(37)-C2)-methylthiotransferase MiaB [Bacteroidales bacterium]
MSKKFYIETYGCQMNFADTEVVASILGKSGFEPADDINTADLIMVNTCSIRDNAEQRVWGRLDLFRSIKRRRPSVVIGVLGCMAERLKEQLLESDKKVDLVVGPDAYRDLPALVTAAGDGHKAVNVLLSREETYADINPVRMDSNGVSAFISIMRGCNNMCAYCVVPYTRGAERSRDPYTIVDEARDVFEKGYREVTLLGQNVDSYSWSSGRDGGKSVTFPDLIEMVALISPMLRVRFSTNHPKDLSDELLTVMASHKNICRHIHLPVQSGSSSMLQRMNRKYSREWYLERVDSIRKYLPDCTLSTDIIAGFCGETEEEHLDTLSMMKSVGFDFAYMFKYSERPGTRAARHYKDDVPDDVKTERLNEIINLQNKLSAACKKKDIGKTFEVLVETEAKRAIAGRTMTGRTSGNKVVVFESDSARPGDYVTVIIEKATSATLTGKINN